MSKALFVLIFSVCAISNCAYAQKNSIEIGIVGNYFFDKTPFRYSRFKAAPLPSISYSRKFKTFSLRAQANYCFLNYVDWSKKAVLEDVIEYRQVFWVSLGVGKNILKIRNNEVFLSLSYIKRDDGFILTTIDHKYFSELITYSEQFRGLGIGVSSQQDFKIYKALNLNIGAGYDYYPTINKHYLNLTTGIKFKF